MIIDKQLRQALDLLSLSHIVEENFHTLTEQTVREAYKSHSNSTDELNQLTINLSRYAFVTLSQYVKYIVY